MRFKHYEGLRTFCVVARRKTISATAEGLSLTKGAVSHQIKALEAELGFKLFERQPRGMQLTQKGQELFHVARSAFDSVDRQIAALRQNRERSLTLGVSTYFASRWLSSRLMEFTSKNPKIRLRIQPMTNFFGFETEGVDIAIRWGDGAWTDMMCEELFLCPAFPVASPSLAERILARGLEHAVQEATLLDDRDGSTAWAEWLEEAGIPKLAKRSALTIPDPNVRVQAVIDGQGIAINDSLVAKELDSGELVRVSKVELSDYGYHLAIPDNALRSTDAQMLREWLLKVAASDR
ncbi:MAG: LysR substrate-binding domain-containing protein [Paracoccaceae bacterium]